MRVEVEMAINCGRDVLSHAYKRTNLVPPDLADHELAYIGRNVSDSRLRKLLIKHITIRKSNV